MKVIITRKHLQQLQKDAGATTYDGCYWVEPNGKSHLVNDVGGKTNMSHEEWARKKMRMSLEKIMSLGWVRLQLIPGQYLIVDHKRTTLPDSQRTELMQYFYSPSRLNKISVETGNGSEMFPDTKQGRNQAYAFICGDNDYEFQDEGEQEDNYNLVSPTGGNRLSF